MNDKIKVAVVGGGTLATSLMAALDEMDVEVVNEMELTCPERAEIILPTIERIASPHPQRSRGKGKRRRDWE